MRRILYDHIVGNASLSSFVEGTPVLPPVSDSGTNSEIANGVPSQKTQPDGVFGAILSAVSVFGSKEFTLGCVRMELVGTPYADISQNSLYWRMVDLVKMGKLRMIREGVYTR